MGQTKKTILESMEINPLFSFRQQLRLRHKPENDAFKMSLKELLKELITTRGKQTWVDTYLFGCVHNSSLNPFRSKLQKQKKWNRPYPFALSSTGLELLVEQLILLQIRHVCIGRKTDPLMFMDQKYGSTRYFLELLKSKGIKYTVFTQSDLAVHAEYRDLLRDRVIFRVSTEDDQVNKEREPGAPSALRRMKAARSLNAPIIKTWYPSALDLKPSTSLAV